MKKRIFVILAAASLCVASFAGCKGGETSAVSRKDAVVTESSDQAVKEEKEDKETTDKKDTTSKVKEAEKATKVVKATPAAKDDKKETSVEKNREDNKKADNTKSTSKASRTDSQKTTSVNKNTSASGSSGNTGSSKPSSGNNAPATSSGGTSGSGSTSNKPGHTHNWVAQTKVVHHDAVTENVWVMDSAAWDEPVYEEQPIYELQATGVRCLYCGAVFGTESGFFAHSEAMIDQEDYNHGSWEAILENVQVGTQTVQVGTIHHDTTGHVETKVVSAAWDETVTTGYKCSCGAMK